MTEPNPTTVGQLPVKINVTTEPMLPPATTTDPKETLMPKTTAQEDIVTAGQRRINMIWEVTQSMVAVMITLSIIYLAVTGKASSELSNGFFLIIGFYFSRTNHSATGGTGKQPAQPAYVGR